MHHGHYLRGEVAVEEFSVCDNILGVNTADPGSGIRPTQTQCPSSGQGATPVTVDVSKRNKTSGRSQEVYNLGDGPSCLAE